MIQSARSGTQNILEGSKAGTTSKEMEIKLTNVGRASLEELLADYRDYLRVRDLPPWDRDSTKARFVRELGRRTPQTFELYREFVETRPPEAICNIAICLVHQTNYLLDQQLKTLEKEFIEQGASASACTEPGPTIAIGVPENNSNQTTHIIPRYAHHSHDPPRPIIQRRRDDQDPGNSTQNGLTNSSPHRD